MDRQRYPSDAKHAASLGVSTSSYSSVKNRQLDRTLSEAEWVRIARKLSVDLREGMEWKAANTATFRYITAQLEACQGSSLSSILCDMPNIGKTFAARHYVKTHANAVYVDCSQVKTKTQLVKKIATEFGVGSNGWYVDIYNDLTYYLRSIDRPLIIMFSTCHLL